jgi:hypothetical protein
VSFGSAFSSTIKAMKALHTMDDPSPNPAPPQRYHGQIAEALTFLEKIVVDGLQHGFFDCSIEIRIGNGRKRDLVIRAGKAHKFIIPEDELPRWRAL